MKICVVGWYFEPGFMVVLKQIDPVYPVTIISHRSDSNLNPVSNSLKMFCVKNVGLEFGAYNFYLMRVWDERSSVLFTHDDTRVSDVGVFDRIAEIQHDCAYIFRDWAEEKANGGKHGRAIFCSARFLHHLKTKGGLWYDADNFGYIGNSQPRPNRPDGSPIDFNEGVNRFHRYLGRVRDAKLGLDVVNRVCFKEYQCGRRGTWKHKEREQARYGSA